MWKIIVYEGKTKRGETMFEISSEAQLHYNAAP